MALSTKKRAEMPGPIALFRGKVKKPFSIQLTPEHHFKVNKNMHRLGVSRSDFMGLLVEKFADSVTLE